MHFAHHSVVSAALADELLLGRELLARHRLGTAAAASWRDGWTPGEGVAAPVASLEGCRAVAAEDIPTDATSEVFTGAALAAARADRETTTIRIRRSPHPDVIPTMEPERSTPSQPSAGDACWIRAMRIAEDCHSCNVRLSETIGGFVARTTRRVAGGEELLLWFSPEVLAMLRIPFLAPNNIRAKPKLCDILWVPDLSGRSQAAQGKELPPISITCAFHTPLGLGEKAYVCHHCGTRMETPNPLKLHLSLDCGRSPRDALWERLRLTCPLPPQPVLPSQLPPINSIVDSHPSSRNTNGPRGGHLCIYCGKLYSRKYGLKIHIRTHTGYKPLKCKFCLRPFGDPSNLNKHIRLHAEGGDAPYRCIQCGKVLVRRRDLERHIKSRHQHHEDASSSDSDLGTKYLK